MNLAGTSGTALEILRGGGGRSLNGIRYPSQRTDTTQGSAPIADHCCQWCDRHPPTCPEGATESVGALSRPFALPTGVAVTAGGLGKGPALVAVLVRLVSRLRASLVVITRCLLLTGSQQRASRCVRRTVGRVGSAVALSWSIRDTGRMQGLVQTRASLEAARALLSAVSRSVEGNIATAGGRGVLQERAVLLPVL